MDEQQKFNEHRTKTNNLILGQKNKVLNRLFNLDTNMYADRAIPTRTKEMMGLIASMVLRCDDCIKYHLERCKSEGLNTDEIYEIFAMADVIGGTIVIPHTRRAAEYWELINSKENTE